MSIPSEGAYIIDPTIGIAKGTKKLAAAQRYIDVVLSEAAQIAKARYTYLGPTNREVQLPADLKGELPTEDVPELKHADWDYVTTVRPQRTARWSREIASP